MITLSQHTKPTSRDIKNKPNSTRWLRNHEANTNDMKCRLY